ncbi:hypothetical protein [Actinomadura macrotermitis]|uniref:Uncharacterized protein n=1 Tax=Actinomadura macrotermitis TaxID=2585200 RepID=A0A7K0C8M7_9ACTN|nr:hypothetical protein [Actinomadura macrotermitis]MQY09788.1 hypothetical protein [Actinomadura macrotermitis]
MRFGTASLRRHGRAGLLMVLFVVAGLLFSYGLEHSASVRLCTAHLVHDASGGTAVVSDGPSVTGPALTAPGHPAPFAPADACLCLAVLLTLLVIALAARPHRARVRVPARSGWTLALPPPSRPAPPSLSSLQVLRL